MAMTRRGFTAGAAAAIAAGAPGRGSARGGFKLKAEWHRHERCYMALSAAHGVYSPAEIRRIRLEQAPIAKAIACFEPVVMFVNKNDLAEAERLYGPAVTVRQLAHFDVWTRDTLPSIVFDGEGRRHGLMEFQRLGREIFRLRRRPQSRPAFRPAVETAAGLGRDHRRRRRDRGRWRRYAAHHR